MGRRFPPKQTALTVQSNMKTLSLWYIASNVEHVWSFWSLRLSPSDAACMSSLRPSSPCSMSQAEGELPLPCCLRGPCAASDPVPVCLWCDAGGGLDFFVTTASGAAIALLALGCAAFSLSGDFCPTYIYIYVVGRFSDSTITVVCFPAL